MQMLDYMQGKRLLDRYKIRSVESDYVKNARDAVRFAGSSRIVLKVISAKAIHKSRLGLVKLGLAGEKEIAEAYGELSKRAKKFRPYRMLAQKMAGVGVEIIIGGNEDKQFGKMLLLGLGGVYVETFKDVQLRLCPITRRDAMDMVANLKSWRIITYDGRSTEQIVALLLKVSRLLTETKKLQELDLNPVIVRPDSYDVVDIRMMM